MCYYKEKNFLSANEKGMINLFSDVFFFFEYSRLVSCVQGKMCSKNVSNVLLSDRFHVSLSIQLYRKEKRV